MRQNNFQVSIRKTNLIPVDELSHHLPPDLGPMKEFNVSEYHCPPEWSKDGVFIRIEEGTPMWFDFRGNDECALLCSIQRLNPITGEPANIDKGLSKDPKQNYMHLPLQLWLDGYSKDGKVYQFVATKAGEGLAVSEYVLPKHMQDSHALGFAFFLPKNPKPKTLYTPYRSIRSVWTQNIKYSEVWPQEINLVGSSPRGSSLGGEVYCSANMCGPISSGSFAGPADIHCIDEVISDADNESLCSKDDDVFDALSDEEKSYDKASMGMGGRIQQEIVTDPNTVEYYMDKPAGLLTIYFALPDQFDAIMNKGKRSDSNRKDKYIYSGEVGGVQVPLINIKK